MDLAIFDRLQAQLDKKHADLKTQLDQKFAEDSDKIASARAMCEALGDLFTPGLEAALGPLAIDPAKTPVKAAKKKAAKKKTGSVREKVFGATKEWASMEAIRKATKLSEDQIRGVLNAKDLGEKFDRRPIEGGGGALEFKVKE